MPSVNGNAILSPRIKYSIVKYKSTHPEVIPEDLFKSLHEVHKNVKILDVCRWITTHQWIQKVDLEKERPSWYLKLVKLYQKPEEEEDARVGQINKTEVEIDNDSMDDSGTENVCPSCSSSEAESELDFCIIGGKPENFVAGPRICILDRRAYDKTILPFKFEFVPGVIVNKASRKDLILPIP